MNKLSNIVKFIFWGNLSVVIGTFLILTGRSPGGSIIKEVAKKIEANEKRRSIKKYGPYWEDNL